MTDTRLKTRHTLLLRLREPRDARAWREFADLYLPLLEKYARLRGVAEQDVADVVQETLKAVARAIRKFDYDPAKGSFRDWLFIVTHSRVARHFRKLARAPGTLPGAEDWRDRIAELEQEPAAGAEWEQAYRRRMFEWAAPRVRTEVKEKTWRAFWLTAVEGKPVAEAAAALGITPGAVYVARSRVIARLRERIQEAAGESIGGDPLL